MPKVTCPKCQTNVKIPKKSRAPNAYNLFVKKAMAYPHIKNLAPHERMKACAALWNQQKNQAKPTPVAPKPVA